MGRKPLRSLDLFSGIGGLILALQGVAEPSAFCDIDPAAQAVLEDRIARRLPPDAPVCTDVPSLAARPQGTQSARGYRRWIPLGFLVSVGAVWGSGRRAP